MTTRIGITPSAPPQPLDQLLNEVVRAVRDPVTDWATERYVADALVAWAAEQGRVITAVQIDGANHLVVTFTDGTTYDAGNLGGSSGGATEQFVADAVAAHAQAQTPHPAYDDLPSLSLLLESRLV